MSTTIETGIKSTTRGQRVRVSHPTEIVGKKRTKPTVGIELTFWASSFQSSDRIVSLKPREYFDDPWANRNPPHPFPPNDDLHLPPVHHHTISSQQHRFDEVHIGRRLKFQIIEDVFGGEPQVDFPLFQYQNQSQRSRKMKKSRVALHQGCH